MKKFLVAVAIVATALTGLSVSAQTQNNAEYSVNQVEKAVYITPNGKCYHRQSCHTLKNSSNVSGVTVAEARAAGKRACKVCKP